MTLVEARDGVGRAVVYDDGHGKREDGTIVRVSGNYVFVRYSHNDSSIQATPADRLEFLSC